MSWVNEDGHWLHRPRWKVVINTVLRAVQPWPRKLVVATVADMTDPQRPRALGYQLCRVLHLPR